MNSDCRRDLDLAIFKLQVITTSTPYPVSDPFRMDRRSSSSKPSSPSLMSFISAFCKSSIRLSEHRSSVASVCFSNSNFSRSMALKNFNFLCVFFVFMRIEKILPLHSLRMVWRFTFLFQFKNIHPNISESLTTEFVQQKDIFFTVTPPSKITS